MREGRASLTGGVTLHYVEAGPMDGPLCVLLHGFPEFWFSWRRQIPALAAAGFRVVAPDMRGYNTSDKPSRVSDYSVDKLARDIYELVGERGAESAYLCGHDWGAMVAWQAKMDFPETFKKLVILNVPHPARFKTGIWNPAQLKRSWYIFAFQLPFAERLIAKDDFQKIRALFTKDPINPDAFDKEEVELYVRAFAQPGVATAALNYYRAAARANFSYKPKKIDDDVLIVWGDQDTALGKELAIPPQKWVPNATVKRLPNASHWVQNDAWEEVNAELIEFWSADAFST